MVVPAGQASVKLVALSVEGSIARSNVTLIRAFVATSAAPSTGELAVTVGGFTTVS
jgi:hypothetical protein